LCLPLLAGGLGLLASLYLPWRTAACSAQGYFGDEAPCGLLNLFSGQGTIDGISASVGYATALSALALAALAGAAWIRPDLAPRLPLTQSALTACYFGVALALETRSDSRDAGFDSRYAYGAFVGLAAVSIIFVAAILLRRHELVRLRSISVSQLALLLLAGLLLGAYLLAWLREAFGGVESGLPPVSWIGLTAPAAVVGAVLTILLVGSWSKLAAGERMGVAAAVALFTAGAALSHRNVAGDLYGAWLALGGAGALLLVAVLVHRRGVIKLAAGIPNLPWRELAGIAAGLLFVGSLFLTWQKWCYGMSSDFGPLAGRCLTVNAWAFSTLGAAAALLTVGLLTALIEPRRLPLGVVELSATLALLVITLAVAVDETGGPGFRIELGYGAPIGFAAAALLIVLALAGSRLPVPDARRLVVRLLPLAACVGYLVIVVLPWWNVISPFSNFRFALLSWTTIAGALVGIRLLRLWAQQCASDSRSAELTLLPVAMLALASIDLFAQREAITWGGGAVVGLCLLLALLGRIEQEGLEKLRVPGVLRVDRL
jgi:hypothetical protein